MAIEPTARIGRYLLLRPLAGDRPAHLAYDPALQRRVRVVAFGGADHEPIAAARALARLREPHLVAVHDVGDDDGRPFVAQEFVDGRTLADALADPTCGATRVRALFHDLALALTAAHAAGVTHGALGSEHAMRVERGGRLRVADFGAHTDDPEVLAARIAQDLAAFRDRFALALAGRSASRSGPLVRRLEALAQGEGTPHTALAWAEALGDAPERRRRRWVAAILAVGIVGALTWGPRAWADAVVARCDAAAERVTEAWNETRASEVGDVFAETRSPVAPAATREVERTLDGWTARWTASWREACTAAGGDDAVRLQDQRMACLQRHRAELEAVVRVLAEADADVVERAVQTARSLPPVDACDDAVVLARRPVRARAPAQEVELESIRSLLARGRALRAAGRYADGVRVSELALAQARTLEDGSLVAEALVLFGMLSGLAGDGGYGHDLLIDAIAAAWRNGEDAVAVTAWLELAFTLAEILGRPDEASWALAHASAAAERGPTDAATWLHLARIEGVVAYRAGRSEQAIAAYRRALDRLGDAEAGEVLEAGTLVNLGNAYLQLRRYDEARAAYGRAGDIFERTLGSLHPQLAHLLNSLCALEYAVGDQTAASFACERALRIRIVSIGADHSDTAATIDNLALVHAASGHLEIAVELHLRALLTWEIQLGLDHPRIAGALNNLGNVFIELGRFEEARAAFERALELDRKHLGPQHTETMLPLRNIARVMFEAREFEKALAVHREVLSVYRRAFGDRDPRVASSLWYIGLCELELGRLDAAEDALRGALLAADDPTEGELRASIDLALARWAWAAGRHEDAIRFAETAKVEAHEDAQKDADRWLKEHRPRLSR